MITYQQQIAAALASDFEKDLLAAAVTYLDKEDDLLRYSSFCYSIRELLRIVLARMAPDQEVKACRLWYKPETSSGPPSSKQRLFYAICGGLSQQLLQEILNIDIRKAWNDIRVSFKALSATAHITPDIFKMSREQCQAQGGEILKSLYTIFFQLNACRAEIARSLEHYIDRSLLNTFIRVSFNELKMPDVRLSVQQSRLSAFEVVKIDSHAIYIEGRGEVTATLNKDGGQTTEKIFPYAFHCTSSVMDPKQLTITAENIRLEIR